MVICVTGNGMKTQDPLVGELPEPQLIGPRLADFDECGTAVANDNRVEQDLKEIPPWPPFAFRRRSAS